MKYTVSLVGFSGSGKSTLGALLARDLHLPFMDTDKLIEKQAGVPIDRLLTRSRQRTFRELERNVIARVYTSDTKPKVVALGGGAFHDPGSRALIRGAGPVIYLSCSVAELYRRLRSDYDRPLLRVTPSAGKSLRAARMQRIRSLLERRMAGYRLTDYRLTVTGRTVSTSLRELKDLMERIDADRAS